jgi:hypothetical protein
MSATGQKATSPYTQRLVRSPPKTRHPKCSPGPSAKGQKAISADLDQILVRQWPARKLSELAADRERS